MFCFDNKKNLPEQSYARSMPGLVPFMMQFLLQEITKAEGIVKRLCYEYKITCVAKRVGRIIEDPVI